MERDDDQVQIQAIIYAAADGRRVAGADDVKAAIALIEWSGTNKLQLFGEVEFNRISGSNAAYKPSSTAAAARSKRCIAIWEASGTARPCIASCGRWPRSAVAACRGH